MSVFLAHITVRAPDDSLSVLYVSDEPVRPFPSSDPDAPNRIYDPRLVVAANIRRDFFGDVKRGGGETGYGAMRVSNTDGALTYLRPYVFGNVEIYRYSPGTAFSSAVLIFSGQITQPGWTHSARTPASLSLNIRTAFKILDKDLQPNLYAGTASGGFIYEGESGLKGQPKPISLGDLSNGHVPGTLVAPGAQVWQLSDGAIASIDAVLDRGDDAGYTSDGDLAGIAFDNASPAADRYVSDLARGLVKLGGNPVGSVGFSLTQSAGNTPQALIKKLLVLGGVSPLKMGVSLDVIGGPVCGIFAAQNMSIADAVRYIARADMAGISPDRAGIWQYRPLVVPSAVSDYDLAFDDILNLTPDGVNAAPVGRVRIGYDRNHQVLARSAQAPAVHGSARESWLATQWRYATAENALTLANYEDYRELEIVTPIRNEADAQVLADNVLAAHGPRAEGGVREKLRIVVEMTTEKLSVKLGQIIHIEYPPADIDRNYILIGIEPSRPRSDRIVWRVWG